MGLASDGLSSRSQSDHRHTLPGGGITHWPDAGVSGRTVAAEEAPFSGAGEHQRRTAGALSADPAPVEQGKPTANREGGLFANEFPIQEC